MKSRQENEIFFFILIIVIYFLIVYLIYKFTSSYVSTKEIFWTGGFDSTFTICYYLLILNFNVKPIYLTGEIDNDVSFQGKYGNAQRKSIQQEIHTMKKLTKLIRELLVKKNNRCILYDLKIIEKPVLNKYIIDNMMILYELNKVRRPICQYAYLSQYTLDNNVSTISVSVEYAPQKSKMYETVNKLLRREKETYIIDRYPYDALNLFRLFDFPVIFFSKKRMYEISVQYEFNNILKLTWSCWYPTKNKKSGQIIPCNKCIMCKQRNEEVPELQL